MMQIKVSMPAVIAFAVAVLAFSFPCNAGGDVLPPEQHLYAANNDAEYLEEHMASIQSFISGYHPVNGANDLTITYYAFRVSDLPSAESFCANFGVLSETSNGFGDEDLLNCFSEIYKEMINKGKLGAISFSEMELALLHDSAYILNGDPALLNVQTLQPFSFTRASEMALSNPSLIGNERVMNAFANSNVCNGRDLNGSEKHRVFSLCFDPVQYEAELSSGEFDGFPFVYEALKACSTLPELQGYRCVPRLQEHFQVYGKCTIPAHLLGGRKEDALKNLHREISTCYARKLRED